MSVFDLNAVRSRNVCVTYVEAEDMRALVMTSLVLRRVRNCPAIIIIIMLTLVPRPSSSKFALKNISFIISVVSYCFITMV